MHPRRSIARALFLALLASTAGLVPATAGAQIGFEDLLGSVTDIAVSGSCWSTRSAAIARTDCPGGRNGYGVEVLWGITSLPLGHARKPDTAWVATGKQVQQHGSRADTITILSPEEQADTAGYHVLVELGLGYSQFSGFSSTDERFELRGSVREVPSVAFYATLEGPGIWRRVNPYVGLRSGLIRLGDVQLFTPVEGDDVDVYHASAEVFQVGGALGVAFGGAGASMFVEGQLNLRRFNSVDWTNGEGGSIPGYLPRGLDFSGPSLSIGIQVHVRDSAGGPG